MILRKRVNNKTEYRNKSESLASSFFGTIASATIMAFEVAFSSLIVAHSFLLSSSSQAYAEQDSFVVIRDAESEEFLTDMVRKIFSAATINPKNAKVFIVQSDSINAFTTGNGYVFITSGMLLKFKNPVHLIAVLCHETGHLSAGHINTMINKLQSANSGFLIAMLAGIAGSLATGSPDAFAILLGYQMTAERLFLRFSRDQEFAADALGAQFLEKMGYDTQAMIDVFETFDRLEIMEGSGGCPTYIRTHPKSIDRISAIKKQKQKKLNEKNQKKDTKPLRSKCSDEITEKYMRIISKLKAFLGNKGPFQIVPKEDYPKAIYLHRKGSSMEAVNILKKLVTKNPTDLYYKESLAQVLEEIGQHCEAAKFYKEIYSSKSHPLIEVEYAKVLTQIHQADSAIKILEKAQYEDPLNPEIFRLLANAYGQKHSHGISFFMLAQEQILLRNYPKALSLLKASIQKLDKKREEKYVKKARYFIELIGREMKNKRS